MHTVGLKNEKKKQKLKQR